MYLRRFRKNYIKKINVMEKLNYHEGLKKIDKYSNERRRDRYMMIDSWQKLEGITENVLKLFASDMKKDRRMIPQIRYYANGRHLIIVEKRQI